MVVALCTIVTRIGVGVTVIGISIVLSIQAERTRLVDARLQLLELRGSALCLLLQASDCVHEFVASQKLFTEVLLNHPHNLRLLDGEVKLIKVHRRCQLLLNDLQRTILIFFYVPLLELVRLLLEQPADACQVCIVFL